MGGEHFICWHGKALYCLDIHPEGLMVPEKTFRDQTRFNNLCTFIQVRYPHHYAINRSFFNGEGHYVYYYRDNKQIYEIHFAITVWLVILFPGKLCLDLERCLYTPAGKCWEDNVFPQATLRTLSEGLDIPPHVYNPRILSQLLAVYHPYNLYTTRRITPRIRPIDEDGKTSHYGVPIKLLVLLKFMPIELVSLVGMLLYEAACYRSDCAICNTTIKASYVY